MAKKRGLGRGLDALLGGSLEPTESEEKPVTHNTPNTLPLDVIIRGRFQARRYFDKQKLQELADSIQAQGLVQPIIVRPIADNQYEIIAGERRWRAAQLINMAEIPVVIHNVNDRAAMAMGLIENIQRDDLNPLEEAGALYRLIHEFKLTQQQLGQAIGRSRTSVSNLIRLLDLEDTVKAFVENNELEMGHARALLGLKEAEQIKAAKEVIKQGLSVRETEKLVKKTLGNNDENTPAEKAVKKIDPNVMRLQESLGEKLGAEVVIQQSSKKGKGRLVINYNTLDELDGIIDHIN